MNTKELETLVIAQGQQLQAAEKRIQEVLEAHMHLVQRADNIVEGFKQELAARDTAHQEHRALMLSGMQDIIEDIKKIRNWMGTDEFDGPFYPEFKALTAKVEALTADVDNHHNRLALVEERHVEAFTDFQQELVDRDVRLADYSTRIEKLETLVLARNASAATKRNMTDEDALRVLTGDLRETSHKEAAEKIGLTYAQVYSCRLEFTFKHVHKDLRDNVKDWKNVWAK